MHFEVVHVEVVLHDVEESLPDDVFLCSPPSEQKRQHGHRSLGNEKTETLRESVAVSVTRVRAQQERESKTAGGPTAETVAERLMPCYDSL